MPLSPQKALSLQRLGWSLALLAEEGMVVQREGPWSLYESKGRYSFDDTSGWLVSAGNKIGRFICKKLGIAWHVSLVVLMLNV